MEIEDQDNNAPQMKKVQLLCPKLSFESIRFSDGTTLNLDEDDIVVLVGPNNAGKSAALRELEEWVGYSRPGLVVKFAAMNKLGTQTDLHAYLEKNAQKTTGSGAHVYYGGIGYNILQNHLQFFDNPGKRHQVAPFFVKQLTTERRITDSNPASGIALFHQPPTHPIHLLLMDENLTKNISDKFKHAFGKDLTPFRAGGNEFPLYVGNKPAIPRGKDELAKEFVVNLQNSNVPLQTQGDGMRSFVSVMLHALTERTHSIQLLDEPEAFLHPPQARLLGRYIAESQKEASSQLFIATHSTDVLEGLIEGCPDKVRIVRLRRENDVNHIKELSKQHTKSVIEDAFARFSRVFDGLFFEHVIICESEADCMFYQSILSLPSISGDRRPDVLFIHAAGKHRMVKLAETLQLLDVPVSVIVDIDILNDVNTFKNLFEKLGGNWEEVESHWKVIFDHVLNRRPPLSVEQIVVRIEGKLKEFTRIQDLKETKREIKRIFRDAWPWGTIKSSGRSALSSGEPTNKFDTLREKCSNHRLWIVPVGELEGFCRSVGSHGPGFVEKVLEKRDLATDSELLDAREFVGQIWAKAEP